MSGGFVEGPRCRLRHCSLRRRSAAMRSSRSCARVRLRRGIINPRPSAGSTASFIIANSLVGIPNWGKKNTAARLGGVRVAARRRPGHRPIG
jgi:hypothetical protein